MPTALLTLLLAADTVTTIKAARMIDGTGAAPVQNAVDNRITTAGANIAIPKGAKVIDLDDATIQSSVVARKKTFFDV